MGSEAQDSARAQAIEWHIRLRQGDDATWDAFAQWLAEDPRHADAYDEIEETDLTIEALLPDVTFPEAVNDDDIPLDPPASRWGRWGLVGSLLAVSVAAAIIFVPQLTTSRYEVATGPGQREIVSLDAGTQVMLNGSTRMTFDRKDTRFASLAAGEALFHVQHDSARPFRLKVGDNQIEDLGTIFNVVRDAGEVRVAVAEGKILYNPEREAIPLQAGQALVDSSARGSIRIIPAPVASVGAWQKGHLVYTGEPLSQVAADLGRAIGVRVAVSPAIAGRPFSGAIAIDGNDPDQLRRLMPALNVTFEAGPDGWTMKPAGAGR
ncbi:FecR domain-containing protein [Sphingobium sp. BYY-5]|uniref:FecR family protein n=1 Tax=Sphingobium sp. BYY-5 TaxID=2926400 RepID=UPI001FA762CB|nr:FecR domain-containing protein [Sphingobium sp. BYY-5]MCI4589462.1 FecR domain-containing protein [Sphingobium sp. BYY-5]